MNLLIIGGSGVLSSAVISEALNQGFDITMINRGNNNNFIHENIQFLKSDVNDTNQVINLLRGKKFNAVIDFICYTEKEIKYSFNLFKDFADQYVFISSCAVYNTEICKCCDEESPKVLKKWKYSIDKAKCEDLLVKMAEESQKHYTIIRPSVTYGNTRIPYGIMPAYGYHGTIIKRIRHGKPIITWNEARNLCNITRVEDFAIGVVGLLANTKAYNEAFNVCGDKIHSWNEVLIELGTILNSEIKTFNISSEEFGIEMPEKKGEIVGGRGIDAINNNEKLKKTVPSFKQKINLEVGIKTTVEYYETHNYLKGIDYAFDGNLDRIIKKYAKQKGISLKEMKLGFVDYLGHATFIDKYKYFVNYHRDVKIVYILTNLPKLCKRILRKATSFIRNKLK